MGIDRVKIRSVDQKINLSKFPWPLPSNYFKEIRLWHILQFLVDTIKTMEEVWRVGKPGAKVIIAVPYYMSALAFGDPGHIRYFTEETFKFFTTDSWYISNLGSYTQARFRIVKMELRTTGRFRRFLPFKKILRYFLWNLVDELVLEMEVIKK